MNNNDDIIEELTLKMSLKLDLTNIKDNYEFEDGQLSPRCNFAFKLDELSMFNTPTKKKNLYKISQTNPITPINLSSPTSPKSPAILSNPITPPIYKLDYSIKKRKLSFEYDFNTKKQK